MKKLVFIPLSVLLIACGGSSESHEEDNVFETEDVVSKGSPAEPTESVEKAEPTEGSLRSMVVGKWVADDDASLEFELTRDKFRTYVDGGMVWDQDYDFSTLQEVHEGKISDDGVYIQIYDASGEVFHVKRINELNGDHLEMVAVEGLGGIDHPHWTRLGGSNTSVTANQ